MATWVWPCAPGDEVQHAKKQKSCRLSHVRDLAGAVDLIGLSSKQLIHDMKPLYSLETHISLKNGRF